MYIGDLFYVVYPSAQHSSLCYSGYSCLAYSSSLYIALSLSGLVCCFAPADYAQRQGLLRVGYLKEAQTVSYQYSVRRWRVWSGKL